MVVRQNTVSLSYQSYVSADINSRRVSVFLSVTRRYCIETAARIELIFLRTASLDLAALSSREIRMSPNIRVLPSGILPQTLDLENFATAHRPSTSSIYSRRRLPTVDRTGRAALYTARWSIGRMGHRHAGPIGMSLCTFFHRSSPLSIGIIRPMMDNSGPTRTFPGEFPVVSTRALLCSKRHLYNSNGFIALKIAF